ncbi:MAG TPA: class I SAM-dependent methyltransferase [Solirubrobacteraceae bacterium]|nr:class I SAM-dependent methyltransferase [Solirubrobacteraceae bacterium]
MDQIVMQAMLGADERHWWYRGRRRVIRAELDRLPLPARARILDAGCGSGRTMQELADYGEVSGIELSEPAAEVARARGIGEVVVGRLEELPWAEESFDLITCLDVIEHTPDDRVTLAELRRVCRPNGYLLLTVPAHPLLWSEHDVANHHYRRYTRASLRNAARGAGWTLQRMSAFNSLLLAPAAAVRLARRRHLNRSGGAAAPEFRDELALGPEWLNGVLEWPLALEARWLSRGGTLPIGLSLMAILRRV